MKTRLKIHFENIFGRDEYFNSVIVESEQNLTGQIENVIIDSCNQNTLFGQLNLGNKTRDTHKVYVRDKQIKSKFNYQKIDSVKQLIFR